MRRRIQDMRYREEGTGFGWDSQPMNKLVSLKLSVLTYRNFAGLL